MNLTWARVEELADEYLWPTGWKLVVALLVFFTGRWIARAIVRGAKNVMERSDMDVSLRKFLADLLYAVLLVAVVSAALDQLGVRTTAVVAVIGAAGLAIGLALQGSLSNFVAGVMIIVMRHYRVGDMVVIGKYTGRVDAIRVFHTILHTADNRQVMIPNGQIISQPIENVTALGRRRFDLRVSVAHGTDLREVKLAIEGAARADRRVQREPAPAVELSEITADALVFHMRPWTRAEELAAVSVDLLEGVRVALEERGVKFTAAVIGT